MAPRSRIPARPSAPAQTPEHLVGTLTAFLAANPQATAAEDGKILFDLRIAKHSLSTEHNRCTLQLWDDTRNIVRHVLSAELRGPATLRLRTQRLGHPRPQTLEISSPETTRRTPGTRESTRTRYLALLQRALQRHLPDFRPDAFRTAMDLEKSFGPAYARGLLLGTRSQANQARAVIGVNDQESTTVIEGILTFGILWLAHCRASAVPRRHIAGLTLVVPRGHAATTLSRMAWLVGDSAQWQLFELDQQTEELTSRDPADHGNLATRLIHAPNVAAAQQHFSAAVTWVRGLVPFAFLPHVEERVRSGAELAFLLHGLEFARIRLRASAENFNRLEQITFGDGPFETALTPATEPQLRELVHALCERRHPAASKRDPLYRLQPERWLEQQLHRDVTILDPRLDSRHVHSQVPALAGAAHAPDRNLLDLLSVTADGRLAVIEIKAAEDPQLALQGLDYWLRVRFHHQGNPDPATGLGEFQRHGYFAGVHLSPLDPRLYLVAPALRIHPATETILRHLSSSIEWTLIALDERWRHQIKIVFRKRSDAADADLHLSLQR